MSWNIGLSLFIRCRFVYALYMYVYTLHADVPHKMLKEFVTKFGELYGMDHLVYNVHSLVHIVVKEYGALDTYSAFSLHGTYKTIDTKEQPVAGANLQPRGRVL